jgi:hypothetical protein
MVVLRKKKMGEGEGKSEGREKNLSTCCMTCSSNLELTKRS